MLASRKVVKCELRTEGSETAKVGTDEQEVHKRLQNEDKRPQQRNVQTCLSSDREYKSRFVVDVSGINWRKMLLPGEVLE